MPGDPPTDPRSGGSPSPAPAPAAAPPAGPVRVTRRAHFNAAHRLHNPGRDEAWNRDTYGRCNSPRWHGHNYEIEVSVIGQPCPDTGYVLDLAVLKAIIEEAVVDKCDHRNLNEEVDFLNGIIPSTENLAAAFWRELEPRVEALGGQLFSVVLYETPRNFVEYRGPAGFVS